MWESTGGEENKPMPLKTIASFKRMRQFQPYSAVVAALRESTFLDVEGEEGEETLKRKTPYVSSNDAQRARVAASVYAKGFGDEEASTQFDIEAFFSTHGHVKHVKLRRTAEELFKGSVFVEFGTAEEADAFVNLDPKPTWKGHDLLIMKKKDYLDEKNRQIKAGEIEPNTNRRNAFFEGKDRGSDRRGRGGRGGRGRDDRNGHEGKSDGGENGHKNGFKGGRGRGRGGRGGAVAGLGGVAVVSAVAVVAAVAATTTTTGTVTRRRARRPGRTPTSMSPRTSEPHSPSFYFTNNPPVSRCPLSNPPPPRTATPTASGPARTTVARRPRRRRSIASRRLLRRNRGAEFRSGSFDGNRQTKSQKKLSSREGG